MASIPVKKPYALKTATLTLKAEGAASATDFSDHVSEITFTPSSSSTSWTSVSGKTIQENSAPTWEATLGLVQDLDPEGLARYLLANHGKKAEMVVTLVNGTEPINTTVTLSAAALGGKADGSIAESSVTLPLDGAPEFQ